MFRSRYLTVRIASTKGGFQFHPNWGEGDCLEPTNCVCTDGCSNCSGECTGCSATCKGPDSTGAILVDREGEVEMVLDIKGLRAVLAKVDQVDNVEKAAGAKRKKR